MRARKTAKKTAAKQILQQSTKNNKNDNQVLLSAECESGTVLLIIRIEICATKKNWMKNSNSHRKNNNKKLSEQQKKQKKNASIHFLSFVVFFFCCFRYHNFVRGFLLPTLYVGLDLLMLTHAQHGPHTYFQHTYMNIVTKHLFKLKKPLRHHLIDEQRRLMEHN